MMAGAIIVSTITIKTVMENIMVEAIILYLNKIIQRKRSKGRGSSNSLGHSKNSPDHSKNNLGHNKNSPSRSNNSNRRKNLVLIGLKIKIIYLHLSNNPTLQVFNHKSPPTIHDYKAHLNPQNSLPRSPNLYKINLLNNRNTMK